MTITTTCLNTKHSESLDEFMQEKAARVLGKFDVNRDESYLSAVLTRERQDFVWHLVFKGKKLTINSRKTGADPYVAGLLALRSIRSQLSRRKGKISRREFIEPIFERSVEQDPDSAA